MYFPILISKQLSIESKIREYIFIHEIDFRFKYCKPIFILLTKTTAARNGVALSYHRVRGLCFLAGVFVRSIVYIAHMLQMYEQRY